MISTEFKQLMGRLDGIETKKGYERAWDIAGKILVPVVLAIGAWMIGLEIRTSRIEDRMENNPPQWLKNDVTMIKETLKDIEARMRLMEARK